MDFVNEFVFAKTRDRDVTSSRVEIIPEIYKKLFGNALDVNVNLAVTAKSFARVKTHHCRFARLHGFARA